MGQQQQQGAMLTGVVYAIAAAQLMKMIYVSSVHQATNTADIGSASSLYHDYVSLHFYHVFRSSLRIEMHQLHQFHGQFIFVKTCSECGSDGFIFEDFKYGGAKG